MYTSGANNAELLNVETKSSLSEKSVSEPSGYSSQTLFTSLVYIVYYSI